MPSSQSEPKKPRVPLSEYLRSLAEPTTKVAMADLERLSGLERSGIEQFRAAWPAIAVERRRQILTDLSELAEDDVRLDFNAVFLACLSDPDEEVRAEAAAGLFEDEASGTALALLDRLAHDEAPRVRAAAAGSLGGSVYRMELEELSPTLGAKIREGLLAAINDQGEPVEVRRRALESIGFLSDPDVKALIARAYADPNERMRISALFAMGRTALPDWLESIWKEMKSANPEMRFEAARAAGEIEDERSVRPLVSLLADADHEVRLAAIDALGKIAGDQAIKALRYLAAESEDEDTKEAAKEALDEALAFGDPLRMFADED